VTNNTEKTVKIHLATFKRPTFLSQSLFEVTYSVIPPGRTRALTTQLPCGPWQADVNPGSPPPDGMYASGPVVARNGTQVCTPPSTPGGPPPTCVGEACDDPPEECDRPEEFSATYWDAVSQLAKLGGGTCDWNDETCEYDCHVPTPEPVTCICHAGTADKSGQINNWLTKCVPAPAREAHLSEHENDYEGECR
jgi:hypothetical protein